MNGTSVVEWLVWLEPLTRKLVARRFDGVQPPADCVSWHLVHAGSAESARVKVAVGLANRDERKAAA